MLWYYQRLMMKGSFEPVVDDNWDKGVYAQQGQHTADPTVFSANNSSYKDATNTGANIILLFYCPGLTGDRDDCRWIQSAERSRNFRSAIRSYVEFINVLS